MTSSATITCDRSDTNYDLCSISGSCALDPRTGTITILDPTFTTSATPVEKIRPYPRKTDKWIMPKIKELTLTSSPMGMTRSCDITHDSPTTVFSAGGYTGSIYHDFIDGFIPLFITANMVFPDRDIVLVPRLILVSRYGNSGRVVLNEKEIKEMLEDVGFEVIIFRPSKTTSLREAYKLIKSSHGMVGVHGAALTHLLFLRPGSVLVQVVPVGLGWVAKTCFESPAKAMKLEYIE
ncbi:unnamed protein product [Arabis nemorensis]|uniref:Glycosyltransferase 61 catalytic domain-containing protein n=1 Tax=Arabis nemorensis TaxID=586526 RepID=A0A565BRJ3_9BRAS|nr:unnamed protein product [Arabis nemorensis]